MVSAAFSSLLRSRQLKTLLSFMIHSSILQCLTLYRLKYQLPVPSEGGKHTMNDSVRSHLGTIDHIWAQAHSSPKRLEKHRSGFSQILTVTNIPGNSSRK